MSIKCWVKKAQIIACDFGYRIDYQYFFYFFRSNWHVNIKWIALFARISFIPHGFFLLPVTSLNFNGVSRWIDICGRDDTRKYSIWIWFSSSPFIVISKKQVYLEATLYYSSIRYIHNRCFRRAPRNKKLNEFICFFRNRKTQRNVCMLIQLERACVLKEGAFLNHSVD